MHSEKIVANLGSGKNQEIISMLQMHVVEPIIQSDR